MYNSEIKERFLRENPVSAYNARSGFIRFESAESELGLDIAEMDFKTAQAVVSESGLDNFSTIEKVLCGMRLYSNWCRGNTSLAVSDGFIRMRIDDIEVAATITSSLFRDDKDMISSILKVCPMGEGSPVLPYLALAWVGLVKEEIITLKDSQVDLPNRKIYSNDGTVIVQGYSDLISSVFMDYVNCMESERGVGNSIKKVVRDCSSDIFLKKYLAPGSYKFGIPYTSRQLDGHIHKVNMAYREKGNPGKIAYKSAWRSGRLYAMWKLEQSGVNVTSRANKNLVMNLCRGRADETHWYYSFLRTYAQYKKAFNLD